jgi:hypothetical protein
MEKRKAEMKRIEIIINPILVPSLLERGWGEVLLSQAIGILFGCIGVALFNI